jgi:hypothetical protein
MTDIQNSISSLLSTFEEFKFLSGYKITWTDSALMLLNEAAKKVSLPSTIPMKTQLMYVGISTQTSLHGLVKFNYEKIYKEVERDSTVWEKLPASLQTRVAFHKDECVATYQFPEHDD